MNKLLSKIATEKKLARSVTAGGFALSVLANTIIFVGVYYLGVHKGVEAYQIDIDENGG